MCFILDTKNISNKNLDYRIASLFKSLDRAIPEYMGLFNAIYECHE